MRAERSRAAVDVELLVRDAELFHRRHRDDRERLVDFEQIDISDFPADVLQELVHRADRRGREPFRLLRMRRVADDARERLEAALLCLVGAHQHGGCRAVGNAR